MTVEDKLRSHILQNFMYSANPDELTNDIPLFEKGIIDSTGVLDLVGFVEETFDIQIDDAELLPENFETVAALADFVRKKIS